MSRDVRRQVLAMAHALDDLERQLREWRLVMPDRRDGCALDVVSWNLRSLRMALGIPARPDPKATATQRAQYDMDLARLIAWREDHAHLLTPLPE